MPPPRRILLAAVATISGASLMLELTLTRIFSVTLFYHFAFLVVSLALFGIGVSGVVIYARQRTLTLEGAGRSLAFNALGFGVTTVLALWVVLSKTVSPGFGWKTLLDLSVLYGVGALPFFFSGMCLSKVITLYQQQVSRVYACDLLGAAAGCLVTIPAMNWLGGPATALLAAALGGSAAALFLLGDTPAPGPARRWIARGGALLLWGLLVTDTQAVLFKVPSVKAIDERQVIYARWNSFSRITVSRTNEDHYWLNIDSDAATRVFAATAYEGGKTAFRRFSETRVASLVYAVRHLGHALIIGPGGGADVIAALHAGVRTITGIELNSLIAEDVMKRAFLDYSGGLYLKPNVDIQVGEGRSFTRRARGEYDSIQATLVDTWAATSAGAYTLSENHLYTVEAFEDYLRALREDGVLTMTRWLRQPPREFERLISLGVAALRALGVEERSTHFFVAADNRMGTFLLKRAPFSEAELQTLRDTCQRDGLRVLYDPARQSAPGDLMGELIRSADPEAIWARYPLDIAPPTDDRPFFFYTTKPRDFFGQLFAGAEDKNDLGLQVLGSMLLIVLGGVALFLVIPLFFFSRGELARARGRKLLGLLFFVAIGIGFMGLEISWMQHFILFLGHPIYALAVVLFVLLLGSGVGSFLTRQILPERALRGLWISLGALVALVLCYSLLLGPLFTGLVGLPFVLRLALSVALLVLPGLLMGRMMPLGLKALAAHYPEVVPWAWGVNGAASVLGSVAVAALSMNLGYQVTQVVAAVAYLGGVFFLWLALRRVAA